VIITGVVFIRLLVAFGNRESKKDKELTEACKGYVSTRDDQSSMAGVSRKRRNGAAITKFGALLCNLSDHLATNFVQILVTCRYTGEQQLQRGSHNDGKQTQ
jgi:hypothetical protein